MKFTSYIKTLCLALISFLLVLSIISFPKQAFESSLRGLTIWWDVVFPALLPFFITSELLMGFGMVHFLGILLEPLMRPLFRVPGVGGFVLSMGLTSGFPMGAKLTVRLREQGLITRAEGERLASITSTSGPLFMIGAVAVGFFHDVRLGIVIAVAHYVSAFLVGLVMRFHEYHSSDDVRRTIKKQNVLYRALQAMHRARIKDGRTIGTLMGDAVTSSVQTLLMIGGFIIMFSVIINIMNLIGINQMLATFLSILFVALGVSSELTLPLIAGVFEITLGSQLASKVPSAVPLVHKIAVTGAIIAWSGLSVHAQVASMLAKSDIRYKPYLFAKMVHALFAALCTLILWNPIQRFLDRFDSPVFKQRHNEGFIIWDSYTFFSYALVLSTIMVLTLSLTVLWAQYRVKKIENPPTKKRMRKF